MKTRDGTSAHLDEAIDLLAQRGAHFADAEARDLLVSADALQAKSDPPTLRPRCIRAALSALPTAFALFNRAGRKVGTVAGGFGPHRRPLCASAVSENPASAAAVPPEAPASRGGDTAPSLAAAITALDQLTGLDLIGQAPAPTDAAPEIAEIYRFYAGLRLSQKPQIARLAEAESLDCIRNLLQVVRRKRAAAEAKPLLILEAAADEPLIWNRTACRVLIDAARGGIPVAIVLPAPSEERTAGDASVAAIATGLAALAVHQLARRGAPLLWGVPLRDLGPYRQEAREQWRRLYEAGTALELPILATRHGLHPAGTAAAFQAACAGADLIAFAGIDRQGGFSIARAGQDHHQVAELHAARALAPGGAAAPEPLPRPVSRQAAPSLHPDLATGLAAVLRREAARRGVPVPPLDEP